LLPNVSHEQIYVFFRVLFIIIIIIIIIIAAAVVINKPVTALILGKG